MAIKAVETAGDVIPVNFAGGRPGKTVLLGPLLRNPDNKLVYKTLEEIAEFFGDTTSPLPSKGVVYADRPNEAFSVFRGEASVMLGNKSPAAVKKFAADFKAKFPKVGARADGHRIALKFTRKGSYAIGSYFLHTGKLDITLVLKTKD
jgi:hypothetical protein